MLLNLQLPRINEHMASNVIATIHAAEGSEVRIGGKLLELLVTLGGTDAHDCPPASHYCLSARDKVWVRKWYVKSGDQPAVGADLALFSTEPDEPLDAQPARQIRLTIAGIIPEIDFGDE